MSKGPFNVLHVMPYGMADLDRAELAVERIGELFPSETVTLVIYGNWVMVHRHLAPSEVSLLNGVTMRDMGDSHDIVSAVDEALEIADEDTSVTTIIVLHTDDPGEIADPQFGVLAHVRIVLIQQEKSAPRVTSANIATVPADVELSDENALLAHVAGLV
ncbi:MAG TPA: hypothetical protein VLG40_00020 [Candidatus Saccharimonas sp.]|nr:hypothetical protein [Candidatus Saccharimonas sp.]